MKRKMPFNTLQADYTVEVPDPEVTYVDTEEVKVGKTKKTSKVISREVVKTLKTSEYNKVNPLSHEVFSLQDQIDAGVNLKEVPTAIYGSDVSQKDILNRVEAVLDKAEGTYNKEEK